ncbi:DUF6752 domain-containing protein [Leucobacter aridicollis]|uniref:DUF6752 domain-containing protein n=1 Tax=Leucobacter aridicollis TaxID=283878 RepID=UPI0021068942|nr:DUF6752 domain-containing protein [Leucobacter aridicollis]
MKQQIKRVLNVFSAHRRLAARIDELERELDEYRRDSLRVAEILDLIEEHLTPGAGTAQSAD